MLCPSMFHRQNGAGLVLSIGKGGIRRTGSDRSPSTGLLTGAVKASIATTTWKYYAPNPGALPGVRDLVAAAGTEHSPQLMTHSGPRSAKPTVTPAEPANSSMFCSCTERSAQMTCVIAGIEATLTVVAARRRASSKVGVGGSDSGRNLVARRADQ